MEKTSWEQRMNVLTHVLTTRSTSPPLHSQLFIATQIPCYPPLFSHQSSSAAFPPPLLEWIVSRFLERISTFGLHQASWRSRSPFQLPRPLVLAEGVEVAQWSEEEKREYAWKRFHRRRLGNNVNPWIPIVIPNMLLLSLLFWDPIP
ncbi:uncharacterized protein [Primulina eburnea]|uniref:uncharacterized protein n=1 Tax=Primulina eburnea TaxID=1245227 RepID=UPI003C6C2978